MSICANGDRIEVEGTMTLLSASTLLLEGQGLIAQGKTLIDLSAVTEVDSSGLSVVFGWLRAARAAGKAVKIANPPENFMSLAAVYDVADQLPLA